MQQASMPMPCEPEQRGSEGCAYPVDIRHRCGAPRRGGSSYCPEHHALCHIRHGSPAEERRLRRLEALARVVGGRRARDAGEPPPRFLERLERLERPSQALPRPTCS